MTPGQMCKPAVLPPNQTGGIPHDGHIWVRSPPVGRACRLLRSVGYRGSDRGPLYFGGSPVNAWSACCLGPMAQGLRRKPRDAQEPRGTRCTGGSRVDRVTPKVQMASVRAAVTHRS